MHYKLLTFFQAKIATSSTSSSPSKTMTSSLRSADSCEEDRFTPDCDIIEDGISTTSETADTTRYSWNTTCRNMSHMRGVLSIVSLSRYIKKLLCYQNHITHAMQVQGCCNSMIDKHLEIQLGLLVPTACICCRLSQVFEPDRRQFWNLFPMFILPIFLHTELCYRKNTTLLSDFSHNIWSLWGCLGHGGLLFKEAQQMFSAQQRPL